MTLKALIIALVASLAPVRATVGAALTLVLVDLITGIIHSRRAGVSITSSGLKRTVIKLCLYLLAILCGFVAQQYLTGDFFPVGNMVNSLIGVTELTSILENINAGDMFTKLIGKLNQDKP